MCSPLHSPVRRVMQCMVCMEMVHIINVVKSSRPGSSATGLPARPPPVALGYPPPSSGLAARDAPPLQTGTDSTEPCQTFRQTFNAIFTSVFPSPNSFDRPLHDNYGPVSHSFNTTTTLTLLSLSQRR